MNKKLDAIRAMKERLLIMQNQLEKAVQTQKQQSKEFDVKNYSSSPINRKSPSNPAWKNPTFWGENPILGKENKVKKWEKKKREKNVEMPGNLTTVMKNTDQYFYSSVKQPNTVSHAKQNQFVNYFKSKRYEHRFFENRRQTPRFQKIKTYVQKQKNPILDPEKQKSQGKKVSPQKQQLKTAKEMFTQNPNSNPYIYSFADKVSSLSPKKSRGNSKNLSPNMQGVFTSSLEKIESPKKKSCRKHFRKYFEETYTSSWN